MENVCELSRAEPQDMQKYIFSFIDSGLHQSDRQSHSFVNVGSHIGILTNPCGKQGHFKDSVQHSVWEV